MIAFDTETEVIAGGIPRLVVLSINGELVHQKDVDRDLVEAMLDEDEIVGANTPFDMAVLAQHTGAWDAVFDAYARGAVRDILTRQKLLDIADGMYRRRMKYSLAGVASFYGHKKDAKDPWRLRYGELMNTPVAWWPAEAREYAEHDSIVTGEVYHDQDLFDAEQLKRDPGLVFVDQVRQGQAHWALHLASTRGLLVDKAATKAYRKLLESQQREVRERLTRSGIMRADGSRAMEMVQYHAQRAGITEKTPTGQLAVTKETCEDSGDALMIAYAKDTHLTKLLSTYVETLESGDRLYGSYDELVDTGRTSMRQPNLQNLPREPGVRECIIPDPGKCLISVDVDKAELVSLAQLHLELFGHSSLAEALRKKVDPHCIIGAQIVGLELDEFLARRGETMIEDGRQDGKPGNFGFWGGMGPERYVSYSKGQGRPITFERAKFIREAWRAAWAPESYDYLNWISDLTKTTTSVTQYRSGRLRGGLGYTDMANGFFQGLTADAMKEVLWELTLAQRPGGPLADSRLLLFIHDEVIVDAPIERAHEVAKLTQEIVERVYMRWTPDIPVTAGAHAMMRWSKKAKAVYDANGRLIPWT